MSKKPLCPTCFNSRKVTIYATPGGFAYEGASIQDQVPYLLQAKIQ